MISAHEPQADAERAQVWVYPPINWAPVARKLQEANPRLLVFGESAGLREFLKTSGVAFGERGTEPPETVEAGTLAMGVVRATEWQERKARLRVGGGQLMVFVPDAPGLPGVYTTVSGEGTITQVTLPVIENFTAIRVLRTSRRRLRARLGNSRKSRRRRLWPKWRRRRSEWSG